MKRFDDFSPYRKVPLREEELIDLLKKHALEFILDDEEWRVKNASIAQMTPYYSIFGEKEAIAFEITTTDHRVFTVVCGANMKHPPIIEAYEGRPPHNYFANSYYYDNQGVKRSPENSNTKRNLYLGAFNFGVEIETKGNSAIINLTQCCELSNAFIEKVKRIGKTPNSKKLDKGETVERNEVAFTSEAERMNDRELEWLHLGSRSHLVYGYVGGVPRCEWSSSGSIPGGCGPCAAAMVLGYWGRKGYGDLPYISWGSMGTDPDENDLQNELEGAMETNSSGSTRYSRIDNGINDVLHDHNADDHLHAHNYNLLASTDYWRGLQAIDDNRPFVLSVWDSDQYGDHGMCCIGYRFRRHNGHKDHRYYRCLTTWAGNGTNWVYVSYNEGSAQGLTLVD